jgi:hypothetical protein
MQLATPSMRPYCLEASLTAASTCRAAQRRGLSVANLPGFVAQGSLLVHCAGRPLLHESWCSPRFLAQVPKCARPSNWVLADRGGGFPLVILPKAVNMPVLTGAACGGDDVCGRSLPSCRRSERNGRAGCIDPPATCAVPLFMPVVWVL